VGGVLVVTAVLGAATYGAANFLGSRFGDKPVKPGTHATGQICPPQTPTARKCPWTPEGYLVQPCGPGFCWDGGPQGALACKQEASVPNSGRTYTTDLVCSEGFVAFKDPCTNVILRCDQN